MVVHYIHIVFVIVVYCNVLPFLLRYFAFGGVQSQWGIVHGLLGML
jgi:hypothetical protein